MGTRLGILDKKADKYIFYGTKLYGCCDVEDILNCSSYKYLDKNFKIYKDDFEEEHKDWFVDECWFWEEIKFEMTGKQVKEFIKLYTEDLFKIKEYTEEEKEDLLKELEDVENIKDDEEVVVDWG